MANESRSPDTDKQTSGVTTGDVEGGIHSSIFAGRDVIQKFIQDFGSGTDEQRAQRNRRTMLELVKNFWVKGVLEQSLHGAVMIELGLEERADAVERPWDIVLQTPNQPNRPLPPGTKIVDVFDEMNRALLILGEPGSGKTTLLLELARDTIAHAEEDLTQPIPVVFNLSSWAEKRQRITEWLVDELNTKYHIPKKIGRPWVENDDLLLLLDGLDEVKSELRGACVKAINDFRQEHMMPIVVCSRVADYEALTTRLRLQGAVLLQPLTRQQVDQYLEGAGTELLAVRETLQDDATLQELTQTPLMLSVMTLAYQGMSADDLGSLDTTEARRRHVLDAYVQRMFARRRVDKRYSPGQTIRWLRWLAQKMSQHSQSVFLIEQLQPSWLSARAQRRWYFIGSRAISGLVLGLHAVGIGWVAGGIGGLVVGLTDRARFERSEDTAPQVASKPDFWQLVFHILNIGLIVGPIVGLIYGLIMRLVFGLLGKMIGQPTLGPIAGLKYGVQQGLLFGLFFGLFFGLKSHGEGLKSDIQTVDALAWSWLGATKGTILGLLGGLIIGGLLLVQSDPFFHRLFYGLRSSYGPTAGLSDRELAGLLTGGLIYSGLCYGVLFGLFGGLRGKKIVTKISPNQGIWLSARSAILSGLAFWLIGGMTVGLSLQLGSGLSGGLLLGLILGLIFGLIRGMFFGVTAALWYGGLDFIKHFTLRFILSRNGRIPWNLTRFLDYAAERIFLRKVGGGYIFVHRLLQDYFAAMGEDTVACYNRAVAYYNSGDFERAIHDFTRVIELDPDNAEAYHDRGIAYQASGNTEQAVADFTKATELDPDNAQYWASLCWFGCLSGRATDVIYACDQAVALAPDDGWSHDDRAVARALAGDYDGAIEDLTLYIRWAHRHGEYGGVRQREAWIAELEAGRSPFDEAALDALLNETLDDLSGYFSTSDQADPPRLPQ